MLKPELQPCRVYGQLLGDDGDVELGIAKDTEEAIEIANEYHSVFGSNIELYLKVITEKEYADEKRKALANLFGCLNGPMNKVIIGLQNK
jgi:hypothetical protein